MGLAGQGHWKDWLRWETAATRVDQAQLKRVQTGVLAGPAELLRSQHQALALVEAHHPLQRLQPRRRPCWSNSWLEPGAGPPPPGAAGGGGASSPSSPADLCLLSPALPSIPPSCSWRPGTVCPLQPSTAWKVPAVEHPHPSLQPHSPRRARSGIKMFLLSHLLHSTKGSKRPLGVSLGERWRV